MLARILISLDHPRQGGKEESSLATMGTKKRTESNRERIREKEREGCTPTGCTHCARSKYVEPKKPFLS